VFDLPDESDIPSFAEPFFMELNAGVEIAPAMNGDDLQKGLSQVGVRRAEARLCPREGISMPLYMYQASCTARFRLQVPLHEVRVIALGEPAHAERHCGGPVAAQPCHSEPGMDLDWPT
jgi:hypothetical protein